MQGDVCQDMKPRGADSGGEVVDGDSQLLHVYRTCWGPSKGS